MDPDPQYGGYAIGKIGGVDVAGIGGQQSPGMPTAWSLYIGTPDAAALGDTVQANGGTVIAPAFDIGDLGRMAVFQDSTGAFISAWQPSAMGSFLTGQANAFAWAELNSRDLPAAIRFYEGTFGWTHRASDGGGGQDYIEFQQGGESILGLQSMNEMMPAEVPSYWGIYFGVEDVDAAHEQAVALGASQMVPPQDFPGGRFAIISDPQGGSFGLLKLRS